MPITTKHSTANTVAAHLSQLCRSLDNKTARYKPLVRTKLDVWPGLNASHCPNSTSPA